MICFSVRTTAGFDTASRKAVESAARSRGGSVVWRDGAPGGRSYGLVELERTEDWDAVRALFPDDAVVREGAVLALAIRPSEPQALPLLLAALGGSGAPAGVTGCERFGERIVVEWDPSVTPVRPVLALVDAELARWRASREAALLSPLPADTVAAIAAEGLQAPDVGSDRILETLLERAGLQ